MKQRLLSALLAFCMTLCLCPAALAEEITRPGAPVVDETLQTVLDDYFGTLLTKGPAAYDCDFEDFLDWMSEDVLQNAVIRVEGLSEQEKTVDDVAVTVQSYAPDTGELSVDVAETVDGQTSVITHTLRVRDDGNGWFIESDDYADSLIHDLLSAEFLNGKVPEPNYDHPNTWKNTGNQAKDIVGIALTQEDYKEVGDNRTKYNVWFYGSNISAAWCAIFISWCANQAGIPTSIVKKNALASYYSLSNMSRNSFGAPAVAFGSKPAQPGDIAYIDVDSDGVSNHVGLVYAADNSYVYTIEGNCSNKAMKRKYSATTGRVPSGSTKIVFFARPNYKTSGGDGGNTSVESTLAISPAKSSYQIEKGSSCDIGGTIRSNYPLTTVTGKLGDWKTTISNIGETSLDIGTSKLNSFEGASLSAGSHTLTITASDSSGKSVSKSITIEVKEPEIDAKERFDFRADVRFSSGAVSLYRKPGDETPVTQYSQTSCVCEKGVKLRDDSVWFAFEGLGGTYWFPYRYDLDITPRVTFTPDALSIRTGQTKTVSVEYSYTPETRKISWDNAGNMVSFSETQISIPSGGSYGSGKKALRVTGKTEGAGNVSFDFYDANGNYLAISRPFSVTVQKAMTDADMPSDVRDTSTYYYNAVKWGVQENIIQTGQFWPMGDCTRAVAVTFLWRLAGAPTPTGSNPFKDVKSSDDFYYAVLWAVEKGITNGKTATTFVPTETCNRGQIVTFLYRYAGSPSVSTKNQFKDVGADRFCYDSVNWAAAREVTNGYSDGTFRPQTTCNRAQIMTFLYRYAANS